MSTTAHPIEFTEKELVVRGGTQRVRWQAQLNGVWLDISKVPGAEVMVLPTAPGTTWQRKITVFLLEGTRVERLVSKPSTSAYSVRSIFMRGDNTTPRERLVRTGFRVNAAGILVAAQH